MSPKCQRRHTVSETVLNSVSKIGEFSREYFRECLREYFRECFQKCFQECLRECLGVYFRQLCDSIAQVCFLPTESSQAVVPNDFEYHLGTMWFRKASRLVRLLITLIEETAQAPGKVREGTHGNTSERKKHSVAREDTRV